MKWLLPSIVIVLLIFQQPFCTCSSSSDLFETWCQQNGKKYSSEQERMYRFKVFEENYAYITEHNSKGNSSYTLGLNAYSDLTHHEFRNSFLGLSSSANDFIRLKGRGSGSSATGVLSDVDAPSSLDWRDKGAVTNVKNQGSCGACWSFSATGAIEGINKITTGSLVSLSEQELIDCDRSYNQGCGGGLMDYAFEFVIKNGGIDTEKDYPFREREGTCNKNKLQRRVVTIDGYTDIPQNDEDTLLKAVATQPVSVGICGSARAFQSYSKGIFTGPCPTSLDHAVLIVGYGSENGFDYWIIKNSWGTSWGINGYIHMQRNSGNQEGICGVNKLASYPTKTNPNPPTPPAPGPSRCSTFTSCGQGETCCCGLKFLGICLSWKCCGLDSAVCCKDGRHCCPQDYPICDTSRNLCLKRMSNATIVQQPQKEPFTGKFGGLIYPFSSGSIIAAAGYSSSGVNVVIWDTLAPPATSRASIMCHEGGARSLAVFDNDLGSGSISPLIVTGGKGGDVGLHDFRYIATGKTKRQKHTEIGDHGVNSMVDTQKKTGDQNRHGMLWYIPKAHAGSVTKISTIPHTSFFLTGSKDGDVKLWDAKSAKLVFHWPKLHERHTFLQPSSRGFGGVVQAGVTDIQIVSHGFLTCGGDGTVKLVMLNDHLGL